MSKKLAPTTVSLGRIASSIVALDASRVSRGDGLNLGEIFKFGFNPDVGVGEETIWDGATGSTMYAYPPTPRVMTLSSDAADDASGGTGARTVQVFGLDTNYDEINEIVTMDSSVAVSSVNSYLRVFRAIVLTAGSAGSNAGTIYVGASTVSAGVPLEKYAVISPGENQTLMAVWTVPRGKTAHISRLHFSTGANKSVTFRLRGRPINEVFQTKFKTIILQSSIFFDPPDMISGGFAAKTDIELTAAVASGPGDATGAFFAKVVG